METLESSRVCRLCGQHSGICINIFDKNENHVKKINAVLPILVHEMDLLPKQMCHRCSYKLEEFHKFYADCLKTDMDLKSQLSWMRKRDVKEDVRVPMVQIENVKIKSEPPDYDIYELDPIVENVNYISSMSPITFSMNSVRNNNLNECNKRIQCRNAFANCSHFNCNYCRTNPRTDKLELPIDCSNGVKRNVKRSNPTATTTIDHRGIMNTYKNSIAIDNDRKDSCKADNKQSLSKVEHLHNTEKVLTNVGQVLNVKIKTEKLDAVEMRSLRPRKKSVDYLGRKRKKDNNIIANPAKRCATSVDTKEECSGGLAGDLTTDKVIQVVRKELIEKACGRLLRPRTLRVDYFGRKRRVDTGVKKVLKRKEESFTDVKKALKAFSGGGGNKCSSGSASERKEFKVKEEVLSDAELPDIEQENDTRYNIGLAAGNHVRNLKSFFDRGIKTSIKVEDKDNADGYTDQEERVNVWSAPAEPIRYPKYKSMLRNVVAKKLYNIKPSENHLKLQNVGVKNGKIKKSEPDRSSLRNLKNRFMISQLRITRNSNNSNLGNDKKESINRIRVPTSLKTADNIKHFCEKCCSSFLNRELYTLHVCDFA